MITKWRIKWGNRKEENRTTILCNTVFAAFEWTWRDSNPRPNKETISFLHAYLCFDFRESARPKLPTETLSSKNFIPAAKPVRTIPDLAAPHNLITSRSECQSDVSFLHLVQKLSNPTILQIKQRERSYFRQIKF